MALSYVDVLKVVEGVYPKALGKATLSGVTYNQDENLRQLLVPYADGLFREMERRARWKKNFITISIVTSPGVATYPLLAGNWVYIHQAWWAMSTGRIVPLELMEAIVPRGIYGVSPNAVPGAPRFYSILDPAGITVYPTPDINGPDAGNYTLQFEVYQELPQLVETTSTTTAGGAFLTAASVNYLTRRGLSGPNADLNWLTVRGAGYPTGLTGANSKDDFSNQWAAFGLGDQVSFSGGVLTPTALTDAQTFFNSKNWVIRDWPLVVEYGMLRRCAGYLQSDTDFVKYEQLYAAEYELMEQAEVQSRHDQEVLAAGVRGQRQNQLWDIAQNRFGWGN